MQSMRRYYEDTMKRYMSDLQGRQRSPSPVDPSSMNLAGNLNVRREGGQALDLTSPPLPGAVGAPALPALDLSRQQQQDGGGDEMIPGSSEFFDDDEKSENNIDGRDAIQFCREFHNRPYETWDATSTEQFCTALG